MYFHSKGFWQPTSFSWELRIVKWNYSPFLHLARCFVVFYISTPLSGIYSLSQSHFICLYCFSQREWGGGDKGRCVLVCFWSVGVKSGLCVCACVCVMLLCDVACVWVRFISPHVLSLFVVHRSSAALFIRLLLPRWAAPIPSPFHCSQWEPGRVAR